MKKIFTTLFFCSMFALTAFAQKPEAIVIKADVAPAIDGVWDDVWNDANSYDIALPWQTEVTTLGAEGDTYWSALWDDDGIYVMVTVADDVYYPWYAPDPDGGSHWQFDMVEIYFDCNYLLEDGAGTTSGDAGNAGHYQFSADFVEGETNGELQAMTGWEYAALVEDPNYFIEYFIPFDKLLDENGIGVDRTAPIGFDAYVADNDDVAEGLQQRAVWVNVGDVDQAWANMDDCGIMILDGAVAGEYVSSIVITGGDITENNGTVQLEATVLPEDATSKTVNWIVEDATSRIKISSEGLVTGIIDGTATIYAMAADGSYIESNRVVVNISNQIVSMHEINMIRNGYFEDLNVDGSPMEWNEWGEGGTVTEGVYSILPEPGENIWNFRLQQQGGWGLNTEDMYTLSFNLWADESDTMNVDFEDARSDVSYNRYGESVHELSLAGESEWQWMTETERTKYVFDVQFTELVDGANEQVQFMLGHHTPMVYIDSVVLVNDNELALITDYTPVESITVSGETTVAVGASIQLAAAVLPQDALLTDVNWSVVNGTGWATIDASGMLTADSAGVVTVLASAKDDSQVEGVLDVSVSFPDGISQKTVNTLKVYPNPAVNELNVVLSSDNSTVSIYNGV